MQGQGQPFWQQTWFVESNWISVSTKWLLTFGGKAARIVLIICTLYMSAELYPGVSLPPGLNLAVFITLSFALDMGGLGLAQIAKTARDQGNTEGAAQGEKLAKWLIGIMIAGLVTVSLEHAVDMISFTKEVKNYIAVFWIVVEIALSIARVICAVNYGHVVHALEKSVEDVQAKEQSHQEELQAEVARLQQVLQDEKRQATDLQAKLQVELQSAREDFAQQLEALKHSQNMTLQTAESQNTVVSNLQNQLQNALSQVSLQSAKMDELTTDLQNSAISLQSANLKIADLQKQLHEAKLQSQKIAEHDRTSSAKSSAGPTAKPTAHNVTSIDQARAKHEVAGSSKAKVSDTEILAFITANPGMKNADIAQKLGISERKIYLAKSSQTANADAVNE